MRQKNDYYATKEDIAFRNELLQALQEYCKGWNKPAPRNQNPPLGVSTSAVSGWIKGRSRPNGGKFEEVFIPAAQEKGLPKSVANRLLYLYKQIRVEHHQEDANLSLYASAIPYPNYNNARTALAYASYADFIGRTEEQTEIQKQLADPNGPRIIGIFGPGGIGKTALVRRVSELCLQAQLFTHVVWISTKDEVLEGLKIRKVGTVSLNSQSVLVEIAKQTDSPQLLDEGPAAVKEFLTIHRILVILDNLDTIEGCYQVIAELHPWLGLSRLLITSRHDVPYDNMYRKSLDEISLEQRLQMVKSEAQHRNFQIVLSTPDEDLYPLLEAAGGMPLLIQVITSQLGHHVLIQEILKDIEKAKHFTENSDEIHRYYHFYRYVFQRSWHKLRENSKIMLICMTNFLVPADIVSIEQTVVDLRKNITQVGLRHAREQLVNMCLLAERGGTTKLPYYGIHNRTRAFVIGEIIGPDNLEWIENEKIKMG